jgi:hypothetical protein
MSQLRDNSRGRRRRKRSHMGSCRSIVARCHTAMVALRKASKIQRREVGLGKGRREIFHARFQR